MEVLELDTSIWMAGSKAVQLCVFSGGNELAIELNS